MFISLSDLAGTDEDSGIAELSIRALCSNRHLTEQLPVGSSGTDFRLVDDVALDLRCVVGPTSPSEPVVRQFLNAQRIGPIGMAEEKDAAEREAESAAGVHLPPLPPIQRQLRPSNGLPRRAERVPGQWCAEFGVTPPYGSFAEEVLI